MKNHFASFFRSLLKRFRPPARTVAALSSAPKAAPPHFVAAVSQRRDSSVAALSSAPKAAGGDTGATAKDQLRNLLIESLDDPAFARALARRLLVPTFPIRGGADCTINPKDIFHGDFGSECSDSGDYTFSRSKVGIGTQTPGATLDVSASTATIRAIGSANPYIFAQDTTNNLIAKLQALDTLGLVGTESNHAFTVYTNNIERVRIDTSGNVGIGTASPGAKLDVRDYNSARIDVRTTNEPDNYYARLEANYNWNHWAGLYGYGGELIGGYGSNTFLGVGNVGIGTTSPQQHLTLGAGKNLATEMATPAAPTLTPATGGSLASGPYYYKITALDAAGGQTPGGTEASVVLSGSNHSVKVEWTAIPGASKYRVYRGSSSGGENTYYNSLGTSFTDTGAAGTSVAPPSTNTALAAKLAAGGTSWFPYQLCAPPGGAFGLLDPGQAEPLTVLYLGGIANPDPSKHGITILRNFPPTAEQDNVLHTLLQIWAPRINNPEIEPAPSTEREATLSLVRDLTYNSETDQEFMDVYNNGYSGDTQYGIRIQKRGSGSYRDFVIDKWAGPGFSKVKLLVINTETGNVGIGNASPNFVLHTSGSAVALGAPSSAPTDGNLNSSNISFWLDETNNKLKVRVKYSNGTTLKTATIDLT